MVGAFAALPSHARPLFLQNLLLAIPIGLHFNCC